MPGETPSPSPSEFALAACSVIHGALASYDVMRNATAEELTEMFDATVDRAVELGRVLEMSDGFGEGAGDQSELQLEYTSYGIMLAGLRHHIDNREPDRQPPLSEELTQAAVARHGENSAQYIPIRPNIFNFDV